MHMYLLETIIDCKYKYVKIYLCCVNHSQTEKQLNIYHKTNFKIFWRLR